MADIHHTETPRSHVTHVTTRGGMGGSALWLVLGAVLALALAYFLVFAGSDEAATTAPVTVIEQTDDAAAATVEGAASAVEGAAAAVGGAADAVEGTVTQMEVPIQPVAGD